MEKKEIYHVLSNTHWDREWYQSHEKYLVRLIELCDRLVDILETQPNYRFILDGQYAMIGDYVEAKPEMKERVAALVKAGQLLCGPWYTQPLENLVGGEALVRNLQYGVRASGELGGVMRFSYEVDEFGHTSQLPQILRGFDISGVIAWRGVPQDSRSYFEWEAPDGSVVNFLRTNGGYGEATALPDEAEDYTEIIDGKPFDRPGLKKRVESMRTLRMSVSDSKHMMWLNGIDHSWAQEDLLPILKKIEALYPDIEVRQSTPQEYEAAVLADYKEKSLIPQRYKGELMCTRESVLESGNALHPRQKKRHYDCEDMLTRELEPFTAVSWLLGHKYPAWAVDRAWRYVLENHAHDSLDCCSVDEVFEQVMARYGAAMSLAAQETEECLRFLMSRGSEEPSLWVFNPTPYPIGGVGQYTFDVPEGMGNADFALIAPDGSAVPVRILSADVSGDVRYNPRLGHPTWGSLTRVTALIDLPAVPAAGYLRLKFDRAPHDHRIANRHDYFLGKAPGVMENEYLRVQFNPNGTFDLLDKVTGRTYPSQMLWEDRGEAGHVYTHVEPTFDPRTVYSTAAAADVSLLFDTPLGTAYEVKVTLTVPCGLTPDRRRRTEETGTVTVTYRVTLLAGARRLAIHLKVENTCRNHRLRALFPTYLSAATHSESGQAFDRVRRPIHVEGYDLPAEQPYPTHSMQDYCRVAEAEAGLAVAARGIYEYECTDDETHALALTVLRAIELIDNGTLGRSPEYFMQEAQNLTTIEYDLALVPHNGENADFLPEVDAAIFTPLLRLNRQTEDSVLPGYQRPEACLGDAGAAYALSGSGLAVTTLKRALGRDSLILRVLNTGDAAQDGRLTLTLPGVAVREVYETDLEEKRLQKLGDGAAVDFRLAPHKLLTVEFVCE